MTKKLDNKIKNVLDAMEETVKKNSNDKKELIRIKKIKTFVERNSK